MSGIDYENIKPYFLRNVIRLINMGFISYDISSNNWVLLEGEEKWMEVEKSYSIVYDSINDDNLKMIILKSNGDERIHDLSKYGFDFCNDVIAHKKTNQDIDLLVRNIFHHINNYPVKYHEINLNDNYPYAKPMSMDNLKTLITNNGTLLCLASDDSDIEIEDTDNFLDLKIEATDKIRILPHQKGIAEFDLVAKQNYNCINSFDLMEDKTIEEDDIDRFVAFSKTLATANPNGTIISNEDKKRLDKISVIQEEINETYSEYVGRDIDFSPAPDVSNTFVSEGEQSELSEPFDKVLSYMIDKGILDRLEFNSGIYITLKSHMIIGTDVFVEAGISEMSFKNNTIKIKHMIGSEMEETSLDLSYVSEKIFDGDIYIRPFDMHKGKKIYTVKID